MELLLPEDIYSISTDAVDRLPPAVFKYHNAHYKNGQDQFENWVMEIQECTPLEVTLNNILTRAKMLMTKKTPIPEGQLHNLRRWLAGRQVCYCHHLQQGDADDAHLPPIETALKLIRILRPEDSEDFISGCTPVNLVSLVKKLGSEKGKRIYEDSVSYSYSRSSSPSNGSISGSSSRSCSSSWTEREEKQRRMSQNSWRSSSSSPATSTWDANSRGRSQSLASIMSKPSWRSASRQL